MTAAPLVFAAAALLPAMTGAPGGSAVEHTRSLALALCGGGSMTLPIDGPQRPATAPCCAKGCHAGGRRRKADRPR